MANSTKRTAHRKTRTKPQKPYPNCPLFPHQTGRWAKCINRRFYYFGKIDEDPDGTKALERLKPRVPVPQGRTDAAG